ncbi:MULTISPECIES: MAG6450 family protein [Empedobacter]|uniref:MAG6450 family protein n=1 Tax=Empedobacter TaxID=59734 RepID=UPI0025766B8D|nr:MULTISPECIES: hypothetical protein [Empedobacter]MDM1041729.1 hypothetical protein [Empedobacter brevis]MDM1135659.1 hypothetical protein [Empedobacter sp. R750]
MNKKFLNKSVSSQNKGTTYINKDVTKLLQNIENGDDSKVIISFLHLQNKYQCFSEWTKNEMSEFWNFYSKAHEYTWTQIYSTGRKTNKNGFAYTIIDKKIYPNPEFKNTLSEDITLFELRVSKKARVHGFRNKSVFYICWLDRNHNIT